MMALSFATMPLSDTLCSNIGEALKGYKKAIGIGNVTQLLFLFSPFPFLQKLDVVI